ncbi:MAG: 2-hydroxyacyl-CoA dehydratase [Promethearchaeota archaeon]
MATKKFLPVELLYNSCVDTLDLVDRVLPEDEMAILKAFLRHHIKFFQENVQKAREGKPVICTHFAHANELFSVFDAAIFIVEATPYFMSALLPNGAEAWYDAANSRGHPYHTCTAQKGPLGMVMEEHLDADVFVTPSGPCDNNVATYQYYANRKGIPLVIADVPTSRFDDRGYEYYASELRREVDEVARIIGQEPDWSKLPGAVANQSKSQELLNEINEFRRMKPCPVESMANPLITGALSFLAGTPEKVDFFQEVYDIVKDRVKRGVTPPGEERFRAVWPYMSVFFDIGFSEWMDRDLGMTQILDIFNHLFLTPSYETDIDKLFLDLAKQNMNYPMMRQSEGFVEFFIEDYLWAAKHFDCDCAIFTVHIGCKQSVSVTQVLREAFRDELGIPMLALEIDVGDKRFTSLETVKHQMEEFAKTLL